MELYCCEVTRRWNGIYEVGQQRWHTETRGRDAPKRPLTSVASIAVFQDGQLYFQPFGTPIGKHSNASVGSAEVYSKTL